MMDCGKDDLQRTISGPNGTYVSSVEERESGMRRVVEREWMLLQGI